MSETNMNTRKLTLRARAALAAAILPAAFAPLFLATLVRAQSADDGEFEVASVKPGDPAGNQVMMRFTPGGGVRLVNATLKAMITLAYGVQPAQVAGGPGWIDSDRFEVVAKGPAGAGPPKSPLEEREKTQVRLQALLKERFRLAVRTETKEMSGYGLTIAKGGVKMSESAAPERRGIRQTGRGELSAQGVSMDLMANLLGRTLGRKVVDQTGLTKTYDFDLHWTPEPGEGGLGRPPGPAPADAESSGPTIFTALQEQLGLRLESQKVDTELIVVEGAEQPTEN
jgi:bla regulator protein blaR1